jgi:SP family arabinose:H+ symporter-like MFS transporter
MAFTKVVLRSAATGALGGLLFGFDTAVIAGATHALSDHFSLSAWQLGFTVSIALWGTVVGALSAGKLGQRLGSRATLQIMAVLYVLSAVGCALAWTWPMFLAARLLGGVGIGGSSVLGPVYIAELAPAQHRGRLVGLFQINIVVGILLAYLSNFVISALHAGALEWRLDFGVSGIPAVFFLLMLFTIPESPRWLAMKGRREEALATLQQLGGSDPAAELSTITQSIHIESASRHVSLLRKQYRRPIILAFLIAAFNQLSGINAVLYYLNDIFVSAGFSRISGALQAVVIGLVNLVATLFAMTLIDRLGRRTLLLIGSAGMVFNLVGISVIFSTGHGTNRLLFLVAAYIACFALSSGAVIWVYMSEIFPNEVRVQGQAMGSTVLWMTNGIISQLFPLFAAKSTSLPFVVFAGVMALQFVVTWVYFPETKGLSLEQLQSKLSLPA